MADHTVVVRLVVADSCSRRASPSLMAGSWARRYSVTGWLHSGPRVLLWWPPDFPSRYR